MAGESNQVVWRGVRPVSGIRGVWPARNSVRVAGSGWQYDLGVKIIYTVPVGKICFVHAAMISSNLDVNRGASVTFAVRDAGDAYKYAFAMHGYKIIGQLTTSNVYSVALEAAAGYDIYVQNWNDDLSSYGLFHGWLEDA